MKKKIFYILLSGVGGGLMGFAAANIETIKGGIIMGLGALLLVFSIIRIVKLESSSDENK